MRAEKKARENRFSRRKSYRFAPYNKRSVAETVSRMETDEKTSTSKPGRCYDCGAKVTEAETVQEKIKIR